MSVLLRRALMDENNKVRQTPQRCNQQQYAGVFTSLSLVNVTEQHKI